MTTQVSPLTRFVRLTRLPLSAAVYVAAEERYLGLVLIPWKWVVKCHMEEEVLTPSLAGIT